MSGQEYGLMGTARSAAGGVNITPVDDGAFRYKETVRVEVAQKEGQDQWIRPEGGVVNQDGPFTLNIAPLHDRYIDLNRAYLETRMCVVRDDGSPLRAAEDIVAPINLLGACMWERVDVQLNGNSFSGGTAINAGMKAYIETMMSYDTDAANTHLHTQFYYPDTAGLMGQMALSEENMRRAIVDQIVRGQAAGVPVIPDHLLPDVTSLDYVNLMAQKPEYMDVDAGLLLPGETDRNMDGLTTDTLIRDAKFQDLLDRNLANHRRRVSIAALTRLNPNYPPTYPMYTEAPDQGETAAQRATRTTANTNAWETYLAEMRAYVAALKAEEENFNKRRPLSERMKRFRRRELYREYVDERIVNCSTMQLERNPKLVNKGYNERYKIVRDSAHFDMMAPLPHDIFKMNNHLAPGNRLEIRLTMYPHAFLLNSDDRRSNYKLKFIDMKLHYHTIVLKDRVAPPVKETYLLTETSTNKQIVAERLPNTTFRIHNGGVMPKTIVLAMHFVAAGDGAYDWNPWNLVHSFTNKVELVVSGEVFPAGGLQFDFDRVNPLVSRGYKWLFDNTGASSGEKGNIVSWRAFQGGSFLVPYDLTPDKCNSLHQHNAQVGFIDLQVTWGQPLENSLYIYYYKATPKVLINDRVTGQMTTLDIGVP